VRTREPAFDADPRFRSLRGVARAEAQAEDINQAPLPYSNCDMICNVMKTTLNIDDTVFAELSGGPPARPHRVGTGRDCVTPDALVGTPRRDAIPIFQRFIAAARLPISLTVMPLDQAIKRWKDARCSPSIRICDMKRGVRLF
jgi:hypothetical protein